MGNCQAAEEATVVIQHPDHKVVERIYWSVSANVVMSSNPGYYVAQVVLCNNHNDNNVSSSNNSENVGATTMVVKQLKLLRPDDALVLGQVYRLISFEDVLKGLAAKKCVKSKEGRSINLYPNNSQSSPNKYERLNMGNSGSAMRPRLTRHGGGGQWRPALQSIAEIGTA